MHLFQQYDIAVVQPESRFQQFNCICTVYRTSHTADLIRIPDTVTCCFSFWVLPYTTVVQDAVSKFYIE